MTTEFVGSKEKSQHGRGQNQDLTPASTSAKSLPIIPNVAPPRVVVPEDDWQRRSVDASPLQASHGHGALLRQMRKKI
jgi:hypothetical protein